MDMKALWMEIDNTIPRTYWERAGIECFASGHHFGPPWIFTLRNPEKIRTKLKTRDPKIVAIHAWITKAKLLGIEIQGWI